MKIEFSDKAYFCMQLQVLSPSPGEIVAGPPAVQGIAPAGAFIALLLDLQMVTFLRADCHGRWSYAFGTPLTDGAHTLTAKLPDFASCEPVSVDIFTVRQINLPPEPEMPAEPEETPEEPYIPSEETLGLPNEIPPSEEELPTEPEAPDPEEETGE